MIGSPVAGWILGHSWFGLAGWRWLFVMEGIPAILLGAFRFSSLRIGHSRPAGLPGRSATGFRTGLWNYTYNGTVTTTTTTTTHENLPYTDTSNTLYLYGYDQKGGLVSRRWRTITTRQGGDPSNTFGYNLGASLVAIHFKKHLLKDAVEDINLRAGRTEAEANSWRTQAYCERDGFIWINNECHTQGYAHETATELRQPDSTFRRSEAQPNWAAMSDEEYAHRYWAQSWCELDALHGASAKRDLVWKDGACHARGYASQSPVSKPRPR